MPRIPFLPKNERFFDLLHDGARNLVDAAEALADLVSHYENLEMKSEHITELEHNGDTITHDIINLPPQDVRHAHRARGHRPAGHSAWTTLWTTSRAPPPPCASIRSLEPTDRSREMADIVRLMALKLEQAISHLNDHKGLREILPYCVEVNRLENVADDLYRKAMAELFDNGGTPRRSSSGARSTSSSRQATDRRRRRRQRAGGHRLRHA